MGAGFLAAVLLALPYSDRCDGLLVGWMVAVWVLFFKTSLLECVLAGCFMDVGQSILRFPKRKVTAVLCAQNCTLGGASILAT